MFLVRVLFRLCVFLLLFLGNFVFWIALIIVGNLWLVSNIWNWNFYVDHHRSFLGCHYFKRRVSADEVTTFPDVFTVSMLWLVWNALSDFIFWFSIMNLVLERVFKSTKCSFVYDILVFGIYWSPSLFRFSTASTRNQLMSGFFGVSTHLVHGSLLMILIKIMGLVGNLQVIHFWGTYAIMWYPLTLLL